GRPFVRLAIAPVRRSARALSGFSRREVLSSEKAAAGSRLQVATARRAPSSASQGKANDTPASRIAPASAMRRGSILAFAPAGGEAARPSQAKAGAPRPENSQSQSPDPWI